MNMVHAILAVLRIIGIVLLIILCALMALLCLILFVPLQYRVSVKYKDGDNEVLQKAQITWLFHLLSVRENYENGHFCYELRLFGKKCTEKVPVPVTGGLRNIKNQNPHRLTPTAGQENPARTMQPEHREEVPGLHRPPVRMLLPGKRTDHRKT